MNITLKSKLPCLMDIEYDSKNKYPALESLFNNLMISDEMIALTPDNIKKINDFFNNQEHISQTCNDLLSKMGLSSLATSSGLYLIEYLTNPNNSQYLNNISTFQHITITDNSLIEFIKKSKSEFFTYIKNSDKKGLLSSYSLAFEETIDLIDIRDFSDSIYFRFEVEYLLEGMDWSHFDYYTKGFSYTVSVDNERHMRIKISKDYIFPKEKDNNNE